MKSKTRFTPQAIKGKIRIGSKIIEIGSASVGSTPGADKKELEKGLKMASKKKVFLPPLEQYNVAC